MITTCISGTNADIMKVGGYKLSALEIESVILEASSYKLLFSHSMVSLPTLYLYSDVASSHRMREN